MLKLPSHEGERVVAFRYLPLENRFSDTKITFYVHLVLGRKVLVHDNCVILLSFMKVWTNHIKEETLENMGCW